jgi:transcriptional regulator with XRE-family HTH domain
MTTPVDEEMGRSTAEAIRRRLRIVLNEARLAADLTQKSVADQLDWSSSKIVRIESGHVPVAPSDVRLLLGLYGQHDAAEVESYFELARKAREAPDFSEFEDLMTKSFREYVSQEPLAKRILKYEFAVVPGALQTDDYAHDVIAAIHEEPDKRERLLQIRNKRKGVVEADDGPDYVAVIDEAALLRPVGSSATMRNQIDHLIGLSQRGRISLYIVPNSVGYYPGIGKGFTILEFENEKLDVLYLEDANYKSTSEEAPEELAAFRKRHQRLIDMADKTGFEDFASDIRDRFYGR